MKEISRRDFLKIGIGAGIVAGEVACSSALPWGRDPLFGVEMDRDPELSITERKALVRRFNDICKKIPKEYRVRIKSQEELEQWVQEITPFFEHEGIVDRPVYPENIQFASFDRTAFFLQNGRTTCKNRNIDINDRFVNPASNWSDNGLSIKTIAHELAHVQDYAACISSDNQKREATADVLALEVLSAMFLSGNRKVAFSIFSTLRNMGISSLLSEVEDKKMSKEDYGKFTKEIFPDALDQAKIDKADRFMSESPERIKLRKKILLSYGKTPFDLIIKGVQKGYISGEDLLLPKNLIIDPNNEIAQPIAASEGSMVLKKIFYVKDYQKLDDLAYVVKNADALVESLIKSN